LLHGVAGAQLRHLTHTLQTGLRCQAGFHLVGTMSGDDHDTPGLNF
jgi:hypothetical protein